MVYSPFDQNSFQVLYQGLMPPPVYPYLRPNFFGYPSTNDFSSNYITTSDGMASTSDATAHDVFSAATALVPYRPVRQILKTLLGKRPSSARNLTASSNVEEKWIGPHGNKARRKRRAIERIQERLLADTIAFGTGETTIGPDDYNVPERIQEYRFDGTCTFTVGWTGDNKQGEAHYAAAAPFTNQIAHWARRTIDTQSNAATTNPTMHVAVWEAMARWEFKCGTTDPAELTVYQLDLRENDLIADNSSSGVGKAYFYNGGASEDAVDNYGSGFFNFQILNQSVATALKPKIPAFDYSTGPGTSVSEYFPTCMVRNWTFAVKPNDDYQGTDALKLQDYYNSPHDFKCLTENFHIKQVYHKWFNPGETAILKAACPWSFQVGHYSENKRDPNTVEADDQLPDEWFYAWRKKYGPIYLFRIRGTLVYNSAETPPTTKDPIQGINHGAALFNVASHYKYKLSMVPQAQNQFIFKTTAAKTLMDDKQMLFADERYVGSDYISAYSH